MQDYSYIKFSGGTGLLEDLLSTHLLGTTCPSPLPVLQVPAGSIPGQRVRQPQLRSGLRAQASQGRFLLSTHLPEVLQLRTTEQAPGQTGFET